MFILFNWFYIFVGARVVASPSPARGEQGQNYIFFNISIMKKYTKLTYLSGMLGKGLYLVADWGTYTFDCDLQTRGTDGRTNEFI